MDIACLENTSLLIGKTDKTLYSFGLSASICSDPDLVIQVSCGRDHSLVLKEDGLVDAWGNIYSLDSNKMQRPPAGLRSIKYISAGEKHGLAIESIQNSVIAWGSNEYGQSTVPNSIAGIEYINQPVAKVAAGYKHSLALMESGAVISWGDPVGMPPSSLLNKIVTDLSTKGSHSLALINDGTVIAWGQITNLNGDSVLYTDASFLVPQNLSNVTKISAGFSHCLVLQSDGTVVAWGDNTYGQCNVPVGLTDVCSICAGYKHSLVIKNDGSIVGWGDNTYGQCSWSQLSNYQSGVVTPKVEAYGETSYILTRGGDLYFSGTSGGISSTCSLVDTNVKDFKVFNSADVNSSAVYTPPSVGLFLNKNNSNNLSNFSTVSLVDGVAQTCTIELWFYPVGDQTGRTLLADVFSNSQTNFVLAWFNNEGTGAGSGFRFGFYNRKRSYTGCNLSYGSYQWYTQSAGNGSLNEWNHVLISLEMEQVPSGGTWSGKPILGGYKYYTRAYLNGVHQSSVEHSILVPSCSFTTINSYTYSAEGGIPVSSSIKIGRRWDSDSTSYKFNGYIRNYKLTLGAKKLQNETFTPTPLSTVLVVGDTTYTPNRFTSNTAGEMYSYFSGSPPYGGSYYYDYPPVTAGCAVYKKLDETTGWHGYLTDPTNNKRPSFESVPSRPSMLQYGFEIDSSGTLKLATGESPLSGDYNYLNQLLNSQVKDVISISSTARINYFTNGTTTCHFVVLTKRGIVTFVPFSNYNTYSNKVLTQKWMVDPLFINSSLKDSSPNNTPFYYNPTLRSSELNTSTNPPSPKLLYANEEIAVKIVNTGTGDSSNDSYVIVNDKNYIPPINSYFSYFKGLPNLLYLTQSDNQIRGQTYEASKFNIYFYLNNFLADPVFIGLRPAKLPINKYSYFFHQLGYANLFIPDTLNNVVSNGEFLLSTSTLPVSNPTVDNGLKIKVHIDYNGKKSLPKIPGEYILTIATYDSRVHCIRSFAIYVGEPGTALYGNKELGQQGVQPTNNYSNALLKYCRLKEKVSEISSGDITFFKDESILSINDTIQLKYPIQQSLVFRKPILFKNNSIYSSSNDSIYTGISGFNSTLSSDSISGTYKYGSNNIPQKSRMIFFDPSIEVKYRDFKILYKQTYINEDGGTPSFNSLFFWSSTLDPRRDQTTYDITESNGSIGVVSNQPRYFVNNIPLYNVETKNTFTTGFQQINFNTQTSSIGPYIYRSISRVGSRIEIKDGPTSNPDGSYGWAIIEDYLHVDRYIGIIFSFNQGYNSDSTTESVISDISLNIGNETIDYSKPFKPISLSNSNIESNSFRANWKRSAEMSSALMDISTDLNFSNILREDIVCTGSTQSSFPDSGSNRYFNVNNTGITDINKKIVENTTYYYRIRHKKNEVYGEYSNIQSVATPFEKIKVNTVNYFAGSQEDNIPVPIESNWKFPFSSMYKNSGQTLLYKIDSTTDGYTYVNNIERTGNNINDAITIKIYTKGAQYFLFSYLINRYGELVESPQGLLSQSTSILNSNKNITVREYTFSPDIRDLNLEIKAFPINYLNDFIYVDTFADVNFLGFRSILPFFISNKEITVKEWEEVRIYALDRQMGYDLPVADGYSSVYEPVSNVNWFDVVKFCNAKSEMNWLTPVYLNSDESVYRSGESTSPQIKWMNNGYRLPLEIEWDYAARGGSFSKSYIYSGSNSSNLVSWNLSNSGGSKKNVGTLAPNEIAIYDMSGNVSEWTFDNYSSTEPTPTSQPNPDFLSTVLLLHFDDDSSSNSYTLYQPKNSEGGESKFLATAYTFPSYIGFKIGPDVRIRNCRIVLNGSNIEKKFGLNDGWDLIKYFNFTQNINITNEGIGRNGGGNLGSPWTNDICGFYLDISSSELASATSITIDYEYTSSGANKQGIAFWSSITSTGFNGGLDSNWIGTWDNTTYARLSSNINRQTIVNQSSKNNGTIYNRRTVIHKNAGSYHSITESSGFSAPQIKDSSLLGWSPVGYSASSTSSPIITSSDSKFNGNSLVSSYSRNSGINFENKNWHNFCDGFTIDFWFKFLGYDMSQPSWYIMKSSIVRFSSSYYKFGDWNIYLSNEENNIYLNISGPDNFILKNVDTPIQTNQWYHFAWSYNPKTYNHIVFLNGVNYSTGVKPIYVTDSTVTKYFRICSSPNWQYHTFNGYLDELYFTSKLRYTQDFTTPSSPYAGSTPNEFVPDISKNSLLRGGDYTSSDSGLAISNRTNLSSLKTTRDNKFGFRLAKNSWSSIAGQIGRLFINQIIQVGKTAAIIYFDGASNESFNSNDLIQVSSDNGITWTNVTSDLFSGWQINNNQYGVISTYGASFGTLINIQHNKTNFILIRSLKFSHTQNQVSNVITLDNFVQAPDILSIIPSSYKVKRIRINYSYSESSNTLKYQYSINNSNEFLDVSSDNTFLTYLLVENSQIDSSLAIKMRAVNQENTPSFSSNSELIEFDLYQPTILSASLATDVNQPITNGLPLAVSYLIQFGPLEPSSYQYYFGEEGNSNSWSNVSTSSVSSIQGDRVSINLSVSNQQSVPTNIVSRYGTVWGNYSISASSVISGNIEFPSPTTPIITSAEWSGFNEVSGALRVFFDYDGNFYPNFSRTKFYYNVNDSSEWVDGGSSIEKLNTGVNKYKATVPDFPFFVVNPVSIKIKIQLIYSNTEKRISQESNATQFDTVPQVSPNPIILEVTAGSVDEYTYPMGGYPGSETTPNISGVGKFSFAETQNYYYDYNYLIEYPGSYSWWQWLMASQNDPDPNIKTFQFPLSLGSTQKTIKVKAGTNIDGQYVEFTSDAFNLPIVNSLPAYQNRPLLSSISQIGWSEYNWETNITSLSVAVKIIPQVQSSNITEYEFNYSSGYYGPQQKIPIGAGTLSNSGELTFPTINISTQGWSMDVTVNAVYSDGSRSQNSNTIMFYLM